MDDDSEYSYTTSDSETSDVQFSDPGEGNYTTQDIHSITKQELEGRLEFDATNVLDRLRIQDVNDELVGLCRDHLVADGTFSQSKRVLDRSSAWAEWRGGENERDENREKRIKEKAGKKMMEPLSKIFYYIFKFIASNNNGQVKRYNRKWVPNSKSGLRGEEDVFSLPGVKPDFTLCDEDMPSEATKDSVLWRYRAAFIALKPTSAQGPKPARANTVKAIVTQAADYAKLHLSCRPFLLFSTGLLIFGKQFCVAIFDRDGVQFSPIYDMWDNLDILIRIMQRMCHEMSPVDLGQDPNVNIQPFNHPNSVACRNLATQLSNSNLSLIAEISTHPTYSINFCNVKYFTIGLPVWNSLSLLGRGTSIWRVTTSPNEALETGRFLIMKTVWRQSNRPSESDLLQRVKGSHDGLVKYSRGSDVFFPSSDELPISRITTINLRNQNCHTECSCDSTVLHRLILETVGRPIWDFDSYLEFFLAIRTALNAHQFLTDQHILHRDINAGNVLLSSNPQVLDSMKGFLTDLEFARIDETPETKHFMPDSSVLNPDPAIEKPISTTKTHTACGSPPRRAVLTGTIQFMACDLIWNLTKLPQIDHHIHHDIESFVWVMYYAILRRIGYVQRQITEGLHKDLPSIARVAFKDMFGPIRTDLILKTRVNAPFPNMLFRHQLELLPIPIQDFFEDCDRFINNTVRGRRTRHQFGWSTYEELHVVLDKVIAGLRQPLSQVVQE